MAQKVREDCTGYQTFTNGGLLMEGGTITVTVPSDYLFDRQATLVFENAYYTIKRSIDDNKYYFRVFASDLKTENTESVLFKYPLDKIKTFEYRR